jgi:hypothetical protein
MMARVQETPMPDQRPATLTLGVAATRASRMVGQRELELVADAVLDIAPDWSVELCGVDGPDRCLAVMPEDADDMAGPTFIIQSTRDGVRLDQMRFDAIQLIAERATLAEIVPILRGRLACLSLIAAPAHDLKH